jgi:hypothetical protein
LVAKNAQAILERMSLDLGIIILITMKKERDSRKEYFNVESDIKSEIILKKLKHQVLVSTI